MSDLHTKSSFEIQSSDNICCINWVWTRSQTPKTLCILAYFFLANNRYQSFQWFWSARCAGEELLPDLAFDFLLIEGRLLCFTPRQHARSLCRHPCVPFPSVSTLMAPKAKVCRRRVLLLLRAQRFFTLCCEAIGTSHEVHYPPTFCGLRGCLLNQSYGLARSRRPDRSGWCWMAQNAFGKQQQTGKEEIWT